MTKIERTAIIAKIDARTDFDAATIRFHKDGTISGILDANKTFNGAHTTRIQICHIDDFNDPRSDICDIEARFA